MTAAGAQLVHQKISAGAAQDNLAQDQWRDALAVAALLAVDPAGLGGVCVRSAPGPVRDWWADQLSVFMPPDAPRRKLPLNVSEERLLGGLDLAMTLRAGRPVAQRGLLVEADGGLVFAAMAERMTPTVAAHLASAMDQGCVLVERDGASRRDDARFACVLYDEGAEAGEQPPQLLLERLAFHIDLSAVSIRDVRAGDISAGQIAQARALLPAVRIPEAIEDAIAGAGASLGVASIRALMFCMSAARAAAALYGREEADEADAQLACRLVLTPRCPPFIASEPEQPEAKPPETEETDDNVDTDNDALDRREIEDMLVNVVRGAAMSSVLGKPAQRVRRNAPAGVGGKSGALVESTLKGRPIGARKGAPRGGARLDLIATLRQAAPWQKLRRTKGDDGRIVVYPEDISIKRFQGRTQSVVIFVVDASGSSAMHRMAEAKGAVELLLSDCYTRRDHVALIAFRGTEADLLLPPTRSLARVRRALGALPGGGGTPLAAGLSAATVLAESEKRKGKTPYIVVLSDGRGNIALNGEPERAAAEEDAFAAARRLKEAQGVILFFDISNRPSPRARRLSDAMGARYQPLPFANSAAVSQSVKSAIAAA